MAYLFMILYTSVLLVTLNSSTLYGEEALISVNVRSKNQYMLGEPIVLEIKATNVSGRDLKVVGGKISIYLSKDGKEFQRFRPGLSDVIACGWSSPRDFAFGATHKYRYWLLYTEHPKEEQQQAVSSRNSRSTSRVALPPADQWGRLALDKPGNYWIKVGYSLAAWGPRIKGRTYESNTIEIAVKPPQGVDEKVWQKLNNPRYLFFLQAAQVPWIYQGDKRRTFPEVPTELVDLLTTMPKSCYHDDIKKALTRYYWHRRRPMRPDKAFADKELKLIRTATGIKDFVSTLFTDDRRLDAKITFDFPPMTTRFQAFDSISDQTGVPLTMDPRLKKSIISPRPKMSLREFMERGNGGLTKWVKDGDGYKFIVNEAELNRIMK